MLHNRADSSSFCNLIIRMPQVESCNLYSLQTSSESVPIVLSNHLNTEGSYMFFPAQTITNFSIPSPPPECSSSSIPIRTWCHHLLNFSSLKPQIIFLGCFFSLSQHSIHPVGLQNLFPNWSPFTILIVTTIVQVSTSSYLNYSYNILTRSPTFILFSLFFTKYNNPLKKSQMRSTFYRKPS